MGLERALGTIFYMEGRFPSQDIYLWFSESQDVANETFLSARRYSDLVAALYNKNIEVCIGGAGGSLFESQFLAVARTMTATTTTTKTVNDFIV